MAKENPQDGLIESIQTMQAPFMVNGAAGAPVERFLEMQAILLKETEVFARHWFQRRKDAIETAVEALNEINVNGATTPAEALQIMADWQRGSLERLSADAQEWTAFCMRSAAAAKMTEVGGTPEGSDKLGADKAEAYRADGKAGTKPKTGHATPV